MSSGARDRRVRPDRRAVYNLVEDRVVKRTLARGATTSAPAGLPVELPEHAPYLRLLTRGAERPDEQESSSNPRAVSARLRAAERLRPTPIESDAA